MYQSNVSAELRDRAGDPKTRALGLRHVHRNVWLLGITSLLTDASSEMVAAVLPLYAVYFLHVSPLAFGVVDALQQGGASLVKLASGWLSDRAQLHKPVAASGYLASTLSRFGLLIAGPSAAALLPMVALDRIGKGIRTAPRDAIISLSVSRGALAAAFGLHRALDTGGAMIGPVLGFAVLQWIRDGYDVIFAIGLALAAIGVAVLVTFVETPRPTAKSAAQPMVSDNGAPWGRPFLGVAASAAVFGLASISDSFIYLTLQKSLGFRAELLPLLYVATPAVYLTLAVPAGRVADRVGRARVVVVGYGCLLALYVVLSSALPGLAMATLSVALLGAFYAATDGVFAALASAELPVQRRTTGLAIVGTCNDMGRMVASLVFGWLWSHDTATNAVERFQLVLLVAMVISASMLWPMLRSPNVHVHRDG
jgi:MFS family permease